MTIAATEVPSTNAGMIIRRRFSIGSSKNGTYPEAGSSPRCTETSRISISPSQKCGTESPMSASAEPP